MNPVLAPGLPWIGNLHQYRLDKVGFLRRLRESHGDLVRFRLGPHLLLLVSHPDDVQRVEMKNSKNYVKATNFRAVVGDGIFMSEGEKWKKQRRLIAPTFHHGNLLKMVDDMNRRIGSALEGYRAEDPGPVELSESMKRLAFEIVCEALFGERKTEDFTSLRQAMVYINRYLTRRFGAFLPIPMSFPTPSNLRFHRAMKVIDRTVWDLIGRKTSESDAGEPGEDLLTKMMLARDPETGEGMDSTQLRDEAVSMMLAGFETTGHLIPWILHELSVHPEHQKRLSDEIDRRIGQRIPGWDDAMDFPFLSAVVDESLRLHPPVWAWTKRALEDDEIRGHRVRAGSILYLSPYLTHRHPGFWERPDEFDPDRWTPELREKNKLAFFPFGMGPRTCVGRHFALLEIKLILIRMLQQWRLEPVPGRRTEGDFQITLGMKHPLFMRLLRRSV
jgi:cytochrome P450